MSDKTNVLMELKEFSSDLLLIGFKTCIKILNETCDKKDINYNTLQTLLANLEKYDFMKIVESIDNFPFDINDHLPNKITTNNHKSIEISTNHNNNINENSVKKKRPPTTHQANVGKTMAILKQNFPQVPHRYRMGAGQYAAQFMRDESLDIIDAIKKAIKKYNNERIMNLYDLNRTIKLNQDNESLENRSKVSSHLNPMLLSNNHNNENNIDSTSSDTDVSYDSD